ncbi:nucleotide sugar dehydrogenase [Caenispirillum bisanense]|uniref:UDP-N-acetyl-D-galactosamine dehydrogenase n=1 Tax=Caenispirillum bisanense TaxID=414052 RepID=A0A286GG92_9PROT|nr:nucleotide sugar dehydrogenase [Caenispirillum bisanense]SOD94139.1 UDP-N-acetyl-D-galactosamine dehydrogenase [Caenispirillum bisanense]
MSAISKISVIGLGYVGLPLAVAIARHVPATVGFDIDGRRVAELQAGHDRTREVDDEAMRATTLRSTTDAEDMRGSDMYIVTVPTPVDQWNKPDLEPVRKACRTVGEVLEPGATVVFESTVYPGVTEDLCGPLLERFSGLVCGRDFFLGYSPERINPGDREHTVERITKVIAGQTPEVTEQLAQVYGSVTTGGVFRAASIKAAEAAKVIENAQRDINIAFINEITMIFQRMGLSIHDVLEASATKWNFLKFQPGLVGGHCIGVDPFYLAECASQLGHHPEIILSGRKVNDAMGHYIADRVMDHMGPEKENARVLVLGLTFKENVPDLRNTRVVDIVQKLRAKGHLVDVHDPLADTDEAARYYQIELKRSLDGLRGYDALIGAVPHDAYKGFSSDVFDRLVSPGGIIADIKGMWRNLVLPTGRLVWHL